MDSFISWVGGKKSLREEIVKRFPPDYEKYVEVFGGGGWVLFYKLKTPFEVYNDMNGNLTNMYRCVKEKPIAFIKEAGFMPINSRSEFSILKAFMEKEIDKILILPDNNEITLIEENFNKVDAKELIEILNTSANAIDIKRATAFYKIIRYSYGSGLRSYGARPINLLNTLKTVTEANRRLQSVVIENKDFESLIKQYDRKNTFFYLDPPYVETEKVYSNISFGKEDHQRLFNILKSIDGKFLLSYNDCDFVNELYKDFFIEKIERTNNLVQRYRNNDTLRVDDQTGIFKEVFIANYDIKEIATSSYGLDLFSFMDE